VIVQSSNLVDKNQQKEKKPDQLIVHEKNRKHIYKVCHRQEKIPIRWPGRGLGERRKVLEKET
jgi:hypothetical protein